MSAFSASLLLNIQINRLRPTSSPFKTCHAKLRIYVRNGKMPSLNPNTYQTARNDYKHGKQDDNALTKSELLTRYDANRSKRAKSQPTYKHVKWIHLNYRYTKPKYKSTHREYIKQANQQRKKSNRSVNPHSPIDH